MKNVVVATALVLLATAPAVAASPWDGTWKTDMKSVQFAKKPDTYLLKDGTYSCSTCMPVLKVAADGQFHKVTGFPYFDEVSLTVVDPHTIRQATRKSGKPIGEQTITVSADGKTNSATFTDMSAANGVPVTGTAMQKRVGPAPAGAHAISGNWLDSNVAMSDSGNIFMFKTEGKTLTFDTKTGTHYMAVIGGPVAPVTGDPGWTGVQLKMAGAALVETDYRDGKPAVVLTQTLSSDGRMMKVAVDNKRRGTTSSYTAIKQ